MRDWKREFENRFVADDILDCIPNKNWEEMKEEVYNFIEGERDEGYKEGEEDGVYEGYGSGFHDGEAKGRDIGYDEGYSDCEIEHGLD